MPALPKKKKALFFVLVVISLYVYFSFSLHCLKLLFFCPFFLLFYCFFDLCCLFSALQFFSVCHYKKWKRKTRYCELCLVSFLFFFFLSKAWQRSCKFESNEFAACIVSWTLSMSPVTPAYPLQLLFRSEKKNCSFCLFSFVVVVLFVSWMTCVLQSVRWWKAQCVFFVCVQSTPFSPFCSPLFMI